MKTKILDSILSKYHKKQLLAIRKAEEKKELLFNEFPRLFEIDRELSFTSIKLSKIYLTDDKNIDNITELKEAIEKLKAERVEIYKENNIPGNYLDVEFECEKCKDTGYLKDGKKCSCLNKQLINNLYVLSNMSLMLKKENFNTFDINVFSNAPYNNEKLTPRQNMYKILETSEDFTNNFHKTNLNMLLYGGTGLGKTFMCNCIAKALMDRGVSVLYQTSFSLFETVENHKFNRQSETEENLLNYDMIFDSELLIIDDLGTELNNSFINAELFNIINERLINEKKMIISTNLSLEQLAQNYSDRIMSRIINSFAPLKFYGNDLRMC